MGKYMRKCKGNGEIAVMEVAQIGVRTRARTLALAMATGKRKNSGRISPEEFQATDLQLRSSRRNLSNENPTISPSKSTNSERITPAEFQVSNLQLRSSRRNLSHENKTISPAISSNSGGISPAEFQVSNLQLRSSRRNVSHENMKISPAKSANSGRIQADLWINHDRFPISRCSSNGSTELVVERLRSGDREGEGFENATDFYCRERRETTPSSNFHAESDDLDSTAGPNSGLKSTAEKMPSKAEIEEFFSSAEKNEQKLFAEKYNYDVEKDLPLDGRYEWVRLKQ
ncbi:uncharacterized protein LOC143857812 isoform X2 [Tasmannia lanceolata]|uniref:uncharacterized protein LOC143857812 isoform X2 n=1 Tax=Tasmannia lanceolata TaxID=3420 RepID=UPI0040649F87